MLSSLDAIHISAVLEDSVDQLAILGHIMPPSLEGRPDAAQIVDDELGQILQDQRDLESRYETVRKMHLFLAFSWWVEGGMIPETPPGKPQECAERCNFDIFCPTG